MESLQAAIPDLHDFTGEITFQDQLPSSGGGCADIYKGVWDLGWMKCVVCAVQTILCHEEELDLFRLL